MAKKVAAKAAKVVTKRRIRALKLGGLMYETNDIRVGDRVTFEGIWCGKQVRNRKFKIIDIDRVVVADSEGRTAVMRVSGIKRISD